MSFAIGPLGLSADLAIIYFALFMAWLVGWLVARKRGANPETALFNILLLGFLAARSGFVWRYWPQYQPDLLSILNIRDGGFMPLAGIATGLLAAVMYIWRSPKLRYGLTAGLITAVLVAGAGFMALSSFQQSLGVPLVELTDLNYQPVTLEAFKGQPLVVNLWATWCPPCRREMPVLAAAQKHYPEVYFVFANQGEDSAEVGYFLSQQGLELDHVLLDARGAIGQAVSSQALPTTLFYNAEGQLKHSHMGELSAASLKHGLQFIEK